MQITAAYDFFVVPTVFFQWLYVFVALSHDRRLIRHVAVSPWPTAAWTAQQIVEAFSTADLPRPPRDPLYGVAFQRQLEALGIADTKIAPRQHSMNAYAERVVGTLRRDCTDHVIVFSERHLQALLREYVEPYYNVARPHPRLERISPIPRNPERKPAFELRAMPLLGGLHHRFERAARRRESLIGRDQSGCGPLSTHFVNTGGLSALHRCLSSHCHQASPRS